jgi:CheY-like chemotaxis protein
MPATKTVLLADDSEALRGLATAALSANGIDAVTTDDGDETVRLAHERHPDAIVLDVVMPRVGGMEALRRLRADAATRDIPVLLVSGVAPRGGASLAADDFLEKPFTAAELVRRLLRLLSPKTLPAFDMRAALELLGGDRVLFDEIARLFGTESSRLLASLRTAVDSRDATAVARAAHAIKGTVANFVAKPAWSKAAALEVAGKSGCLDGVPALADALEAEVLRLAHELAVAAESGEDALPACA